MCRSDTSDRHRKVEKVHFDNEGIAEKCIELTPLYVHTAGISVGVVNYKSKNSLNQSDFYRENRALDIISLLF